MKPFVINRYGHLVFPANFLGDLDFSVLETLEQFAAVIGRDFEAKAPTGTDILARVESGAYPGRFELLRDLGQNLYWVNRYAITMFDKRPTRWRDLAKYRDDVFLPVLTPWEDSERKVAAVERAFRALPATWDADTENRVFDLLFDLFRTKLHHATELTAIKPTVAEFGAQSGAMTFVMPSCDPDYPLFRTEDIIDAHESVPELEALMRWAMVLHNQYPWDRSRTELRGAAGIGDDDFVVAFHPRNRDVMAFIDRVKRSGRAGAGHDTPARREPIGAVAPATPYPPVRVREAFAIQPKFEALAIVRGEHVCDNADVIRNASFSWSPMSASEISAKTGIEQRRYTSREPEQLALHAARAALAKSGRSAADIGAILVSTCTNNRQIPSTACWLSGELGLLQTHASVDMAAACAGLPYGLAEAIRQLQEVSRPVLLVCVEKFSDKIGSVRTSRMIFGDGAAAMVIGPAPAGEAGDVEVVQTYASGPCSEVNSIIWPNSEFDGDITVYGPEVKSLVQRYLVQMLGELGAQPDPDDPENPGRTLLDSIELIVPHQANKTMILTLASKAGLSADQLYFNVERMGNVSAASIPIAVYDAVRDGVITRPARIFAPGFGAGAVGGYAVMRINPAIVADEVVLDIAEDVRSAASRMAGSTSEDIRAAFGG